MQPGRSPVNPVLFLRRLDPTTDPHTRRSPRRREDPKWPLGVPPQTNFFGPPTRLGCSQMACLSMELVPAKISDVAQLRESPAECALSRIIF